MTIARIAFALLVAVPLAAAPATALRVTLPASVTVKVPFNFTVEAVDGSGTVDSGYTGTVDFSSTDSTAFLPADAAFTAGDGGVRTFSATINEAGDIYITAADTANAAINGNDWTSAEYSASVVTDFVLEVLTDPVVRNDPFQMKVTAVNHLGQKVTSYTGSVQASVQYATILPPVYTFTAADAGEHTFTLGTSRGGQVVAGAQDQGNTTIGQSQIILVTCPDFTVAASNDGPVCQGTPVQLTANANQPADYWWQGPRHFTEQSGATVSTTLAGTYTVTATQPSTGCVATATTDVEFHRPALASVPASVCGLAEVELSLATPLANVQWSITNGTLISGQGTSNVVVRAANPSAGVTDLMVDVSGTDAEHGCTYENLRLATIDLILQPEPNITVSTGPFCAGQPATATVDVTNPAWPRTWSIQNGTITNESSSGITWSPNGSDPVVIGVEVSNGTCAGSDTVTIPAAATPTATVDSTPQSICSGDSAAVSVALSGQPPFRIIWSDGVVTAGINTTSYTRTVTPPSDVVLSIIELSDASCTGLAFGAAEIDVAPGLSIDRQPEGGTVQRGARFELSVETSGATGWQWYEGESGDTAHPIDGATADTYVTPPLDRTTSYWVRVTSPSCGSVDSFTATVVVESPRRGKRRAVRH